MIEPRMLHVRDAGLQDIAALQRVRRAVRENRLSDPSRVTDADVAAHLTTLGRGWVAEIDGEVVGFAIGRTDDASIWALFVDPEHEQAGIGSRLHDTMVEGMRTAGLHSLWLTTGRDTRAERFYQYKGWQLWPPHPDGEVRLRLQVPAA